MSAALWTSAQLASATGATVTPNLAVSGVSIDSRSCGGVCRFEMSRIPNRDKWSVRGIGVALSVRTSISSLSRLSISLASTPNEPLGVAVGGGRAETKKLSLQQLGGARWEPHDEKAD